MFKRMAAKRARRVDAERISQRVTDGVCITAVAARSDDWPST